MAGIRNGDRGWLFSAGSALLLAVVVGFVLVNQDTPSAEGSGAAPSPQTTTSPEPTRAPTLRELADRANLRLGSAVNVRALTSDPDYAEVLGREFNSITAEDVMKWTAVEPHPGVYNWSQADAVVDFAMRHGQRVYGHVLLWHGNEPAWLEPMPYGQVGAAALMRRHIQDQMSRYRGKVWAWEVVNEPLGPDNKLRDSVWLRHLGPDYIAQAFRWARAADPEAKLFLNEGNAETLGPRSDALYRLVKKLLDEGVPIDGIGFQAHLTTGTDTSTVVKNLRRFAALGLDIALTEVDVRMTGPVTSGKLAAQATVYRNLIEACLAVSRCVSVTVWGFTDKYSWIPAAFPRYGASCLFDAKLRPKPAYHAFSAALAKSRR